VYMSAKSKTPGMTQTEIAAKLGLSHERVGQIERRAFVKLRRLIHGTNDFPMLADSFADCPDGWFPASRRDELRRTPHSGWISHHEACAKRLLARNP